MHDLFDRLELAVMMAVLVDTDDDYCGKNRNFGYCFQMPKNSRLTVAVDVHC